MPHVVNRTISKVATLNVQREGGGFLVRKVIGGQIASCDPFLLLDHIGPMKYKPGEAVGAPDHPHRGFETVTYVIEGGVKHEDSAGNKGELRSGWVQWMTAGRGVVHSEMPTDDLLRDGGTWEGFQLWVNLPGRDKMMQPNYQDIPPELIPVVHDQDGGIVVKVIAGTYQGTKSSTVTRTPILLLDVRIEAGRSFLTEVPVSFNGFIYVWKGSGHIGNDMRLVSTGTVGVLGPGGSTVLVKASDEEACHILLAAGEPLNEPVVQYGPFVMNTEEEIQQAIDDYRNGKLGFVHLNLAPPTETSAGDLSQSNCSPLMPSPLEDIHEKFLNGN